MSLPLQRSMFLGLVLATLASSAAADAQYSSQVSPPVIPAPAIGAATTTTHPLNIAPGPQAATANPDSTPPASEQWVDQQTAKVRSEVEGRVARGEMNPDEAERLIAWRHWQFEQQAAGRAPQSQIIARQDAVGSTPNNAMVIPAPQPYYAPYPGRYYVAPGYAPYYGSYYPPAFVPFGIGFCAGGVGHNFAGRVCF